MHYQSWTAWKPGRSHPKPLRFGRSKRLDDLRLHAIGLCGSGSPQSHLGSLQIRLAIFCQGWEWLKARNERLIRTSNTVLYQLLMLPELMLNKPKCHQGHGGWESQLIIWLLVLVSSRSFVGNGSLWSLIRSQTPAFLPANQTCACKPWASRFSSIFMAVEGGEVPLDQGSHRWLMDWRVHKFMRPLWRC